MCQGPRHSWTSFSQDLGSLGRRRLSLTNTAQQPCGSDLLTPLLASGLRTKEGRRQLGQAQGRPAPAESRSRQAGASWAGTFPDKGQSLPAGRLLCFRI